MTHDEAHALLLEYTKSDALLKHMYAVEGAMRAYAAKFGEDEETWGIVGLLHDFDYERYPEAPDHPLKGSEILASRGYPEAITTRTFAGRRRFEPVDGRSSITAPFRTFHDGV